MDFRNITSPSSIAAPHARLQIGPTQDVSNWTRSLIVDWGDAPSGKAALGRYAVGNLTGSAVLVKFPDGTTFVDPVLVGTSSVLTATEYSIQRKAFAYADRYWAFWYDGTNIAYSSSRDGTAWNAKMSTASGAISYGFDVDQRDGKVLVGYVPNTHTSLKVLVGTITGSFITWSGPYTVVSWSITENGPPTVVIGTDGYYWASVPHRETSTQGRSHSGRTP
ncbi:MAG: hypothetical protein WC941_11120 [Candidatus Bathyarchaeia archaeon]